MIETTQNDFEVERKFVVGNPDGLKEQAFKVEKIKQAYIGQGEHFIQRVRAKEVYSSDNNFKMGICSNKQGLMTIKEMVEGNERFESEQPWNLNHVYLMIEREKEKIEKVRYCISQVEKYNISTLTEDQINILLKKGGSEISEDGSQYIEVVMTWEVDFFEGDNSGLVVAEIELYFKGQEVTIPDWIEREVTDKIRYYNSNLAENPYNTW